MWPELSHHIHIPHCIFALLSINLEMLCDELWH